MFSGVGCGIMVNSEIYTGSDGCAGELFINYLPGQESSYLGDCSFFKQWPHDLGLIDRTKQVLSKDDALTIHGLEDIFAWAKKDTKVKSLVSEAAKALGVKIALLTNIFNPQVIIVGGGLEKGGFDFIDRVYQSIKVHAFDEMVKNLKVIPSTLGDEAVALGAANLVVRNIFTFT
jgi:glucokinase